MSIPKKRIRELVQRSIAGGATPPGSEFVTNEDAIVEDVFVSGNHVTFRLKHNPPSFHCLADSGEIAEAIGALARKHCGKKLREVLDLELPSVARGQGAGEG